MPKFEIKKIETNQKTGGFCCDFTYNGQDYWADLSYVPFCGNECMVFAKDCTEPSGINWTDLYCNRDVPISIEALINCIVEFVSEDAEEDAK